MIDAPVGDRSDWQPHWPELEDYIVPIGKAELVREGDRGHGRQLRPPAAAVRAGGRRTRAASTAAAFDVIDLRSIFPYDWETISRERAEDRPGADRERGHRGDELRRAPAAAGRRRALLRPAGAAADADGQARPGHRPEPGLRGRTASRSWATSAPRCGTWRPKPHKTPHHKGTKIAQRNTKKTECRFSTLCPLCDLCAFVVNSSFRRSDGFPSPAGRRRPVRGGAGPLAGAAGRRGRARAGAGRGDVRQGDMEVPSPFAGTVTALARQPGTKVKVGERLLSYNAVGEGAGRPTPPAPLPEGKGESAPKQLGKPRAAASDLPPPSLQGGGPGRRLFRHQRPLAAARRAVGAALARKLGVDLAGVRGSGPHGRILLDDLTPYLTPRPAAPRPVVPRAAPTRPSSTSAWPARGRSSSACGGRSPSTWSSRSGTSRTTRTSTSATSPTWCGSAPSSASRSPRPA